MRAPVATVRTLMQGLVDYAGLFPPATLTMSDAVAQYDAHRRSTDAWMLGYFIVPAERLSELSSEVRRRGDAAMTPLRLSVIVGDDTHDAGARIRGFNESQRGELRIEGAELRPVAADRVAAAVAELTAEVACFVELPIRTDPAPLLAAIGASGARAKLRTGGVTSDAFPPAADIVRFLRRCVQLNVPFKATAGLHHPLAGEHALTYEAAAPRANMFGFLNIFAAAMFASDGMPDATLLDVVTETDPQSFAFDERAMRWRDHSVQLERIAAARTSLATAFGSCSFDEPVAGLRALGFL